MKSFLIAFLSFVTLTLSCDLCHAGLLDLDDDDLFYGEPPKSASQLTAQESTAQSLINQQNDALQLISSETSLIPNDYEYVGTLDEIAHEVGSLPQSSSVTPYFGSGGEGSTQVASSGQEAGEVGGAAGSPESAESPAQARARLQTWINDHLVIEQGVAKFTSQTWTTTGGFQTNKEAVTAWITRKLSEAATVLTGSGSTEAAFQQKINAVTAAVTALQAATAQFLDTLTALQQLDSAVNDLRAVSHNVSQYWSDTAEMYVVMSLLSQDQRLTQAERTQASAGCNAGAGYRQGLNAANQALTSAAAAKANLANRFALNNPQRNANLDGFALYLAGKSGELAMLFENAMAINAGGAAGVNNIADLGQRTVNLLNLYNSMQAQIPQFWDSMLPQPLLNAVKDEIEKAIGEYNSAKATAAAQRNAQIRQILEQAWNNPAVGNFVRDHANIAMPMPQVGAETQINLVAASLDILPLGAPFDAIRSLFQSGELQRVTITIRVSAIQNNQVSFSYDIQDRYCASQAAINSLAGPIRQQIRAGLEQRVLNRLAQAAAGSTLPNGMAVRMANYTRFLVNINQIRMISDDLFLQMHPPVPSGGAPGSSAPGSSPGGGLVTV